MQGSPGELRWNRKDLESLKSTLDFVIGRRVVVQAGACLGVFPDYLAGVFQRVYTFEPDPELFVKMTANAPQSNIVRFQAALGRERRLVKTVCELRGNDGKSELHEGMTRTESGGAIPTIRIDDLGLDVCDLIYLDVEGDELYALQGARETIMKHRPVIACEINRGVEYRGFRQQDVFTHLNILGYNHVATYRSDKVFVSVAV